MQTNCISNRHQDRAGHTAFGSSGLQLLSALCVSLLTSAGVAGDYGAWVYGTVGYMADFVPHYQDQTAANDLLLSSTGDPFISGSVPRAEMEGHAAFGTLKARASGQYSLVVGDLVEAYGTFNLMSSALPSYRELLTISGGNGYDGQAATYTMNFSLTGTGSQNGLIKRRVSYEAHLYSDGHYFIKPGGEGEGGGGDTQVTDWWLYGDGSAGDKTYNEARSMTIHGVTLGQPVDLELDLYLSVQAYVQKGWLPRDGQAEQQFRMVGRIGIGCRQVAFLAGRSPAVLTTRPLGI